MGLNEDLCALTGMTDEQIAGLRALEAMSSKEQRAFAQRVAEAWDSNVADVQAARDVLRAAVAECKAAATRYAEVTAPFRPRIASRMLSPTEAELEHEAAMACVATYQAKVTAEEDVLAANARFKQGVTAEQLEAG